LIFVRGLNSKTPGVSRLTLSKSRREAHGGETKKAKKANKMKVRAKMTKMIKSTNWNFKMRCRMRMKEERMKEKEVGGRD